jgi:hypothetical protein
VLDLSSLDATHRPLQDLRQPQWSPGWLRADWTQVLGAALAGGAIAGPIGAFVALPVAALITAFVSTFVPMNEVVYEFEYDQHLVAAKEAAEDRSATND